MGAACSCGSDPSKVYRPTAAPVATETSSAPKFKVHPVAVARPSSEASKSSNRTQARESPPLPKSKSRSSNRTTTSSRPSHRSTEMQRKSNVKSTSSGIPRESGIDSSARTREANQPVTLTIDGKTVTSPATATILDACRANGIHVPTLCHHPRLKPPGRCRVCTVEVMGSETHASFKLACSSRVMAGITVETDTPEVRAERSTAVRAMLAKQKVVAKSVAAIVPGSEFASLVGTTGNAFIDDSSPSVFRDMSLCVDCGRCISACRDIQGIQVLSHSTDPDAPNAVDTQAGLPLDQTDCVRCGQCSAFCPTGAITEKDDSAIVRAILDDPNDKRLSVVQFAPSTRVAISEEFGMKPGTVSTGKMVAALRRLGFGTVFDTNMAADLTIMEEGTEFLARVKEGGTLPLFTSCCPAWVTYIEKMHPDLIPHLSTAKSPQQMMGAVIKSFYAEKMGLKPADIYSVSVMPCTAKKYELTREDNMSRDGKSRDVDNVLTTRELARMIREAKIDFEHLEDEVADSPLGASTGAAVIFGASGGVMEAALRTVYEVVTGKTLSKLDFEAVRGIKGMKKTSIELPDRTVNVGVTHGLANAKQTITSLKDGSVQLDFLEVMACPGGCIGGGGQPRSNIPDILEQRMAGIYSIDEHETIRKSHENPDVKALYADYLTEPNSVKSHELLHTSYHDLAQEMGRLVRKRPKKVVKVAYEGVATGSTVAGANGSGGQAAGECVTIIYGTNTGTAEEAARQILAKCKQRGYRARLIRASQYDFSKITDEVMVVIVIATCGDGEIPDDSTAFFAWLKQEHPPKFLRNLRFAVFGLGSRDYECFCQAGKLFEKRLLTLGAKESHPRGDGDEAAPEHYNEALDPWMETAVASVPKELLESAPRMPYIVQYHDMKPPDEVMPEGAQRLVVLKNTAMSTADSAVDVRLLELSIPSDGVKFGPADLLSVSPRNLPDVCRQFITQYGLNPDDVISIKASSSSIPLPLPPQLTIQQLFESYLDIFGRPTRSFFEKLAVYATNEREQKAIGRLSNVRSNAQQFKSYYESGATYADALKEFPSARPPLGTLLDMVRMIRPRRYTIASPPYNEMQKRLEILLIVDHFETARGWKTGICSSFLEECSGGEHIAATVSHTRLRFPEDETAPVVMVGVGAGIASFRSFISYRKCMLDDGYSGKFGETMLFYGFGSESRDFFFKDDFEEFVEAGALTHFVPVAQEDDEQNVIDVIGEYLEQIASLLNTRNGTFLLAGPSTISPAAVSAAIERSFVDVIGKDERSAKQIIRTMKKEHRYCVEFHGTHQLGEGSSDSGSMRSSTISSSY